MSYATIKVDIEVDDVLDAMTEKETVEMVSDLLGAGYVPEGWVRDTGVPILSNPTVLLAVITELRAMGYTVEPEGVE